MRAAPSKRKLEKKNDRESCRKYTIVPYIIPYIRLEVISMRAAPGKRKLQKRNDRERGEVGQHGLHAHHRVHLESRLIFLYLYRALGAFAWIKRQKETSPFYQAQNFEAPFF